MSESDELGYISTEGEEALLLKHGLTLREALEYKMLTEGDLTVYNRIMGTNTTPLEFMLNNPLCDELRLHVLSCLASSGMCETQSDLDEVKLFFHQQVISCLEGKSVSWHWV